MHISALEADKSVNYDSFDRRGHDFRFVDVLFSIINLKLADLYALEAKIARCNKTNVSSNYTVNVPIFVSKSGFKLKDFIPIRHLFLQQESLWTA